MGGKESDMTEQLTLSQLKEHFPGNATVLVLSETMTTELWHLSKYILVSSVFVPLQGMIISKEY